MPRSPTSTNFMLAKLLYNYSGKKPCRLIQSKGKPYLERYYLGQLLGYTFYLHRFVDADGDRALHDHPWKRCLAICLVGGYQEKRLRWFDPARGVDCLEKKVSAGSFNAIGANTFHQVLSVIPGTWTLFIHSIKIKDWGFMEASVTPGDATTTEVVARYHADRDTVSHKNWWQTAANGAESKRAPRLL